MPTRETGDETRAGELILPDACWPDHAPLSLDAVRDAQKHAVLALQRFVADEHLPQAYISVFPRLIIPMAAWLLREQQNLGRPLKVGIGGSQGSGKTTLCRGLRLVLHHCFAVSSCVLSLDDFYLPRNKRLNLAEWTHPLFATRGVPGTHDMTLLMKTLASLEDADSRRVTMIPAFDKSHDDRLPESAFTRFQGRPGILFVEGWCLGARAQTEEQIRQPVNQLESKQDPDRRWRYAVNELLKAEYRQLNEAFDRFIFLRAPDWESVRRWRLLQEAKLIRRAGETYRGHLDEGPAFERFMAHFERITRQLLETPSPADVALAVDACQRLTHLRFGSQTLKNQ